MPLSEFLVASGDRIKGGDHGVVYASYGQVWFLKAPKIGIDSNLFGALKIVVDSLRIIIAATSIDTGQHVPGSRHYDGRAIDLGLLWEAGSGITPAHLTDPVLLAKGRLTLANPLALKLARYLLDNGFHVGEGAPPRPGLLFGPVHTTWNSTGIDHRTHLHASLPRAVRPGESQQEEQEPEDFCEPEEGFSETQGLRENLKNSPDSISSLRKGIRGPRVLRPQSCTVPTPLLRRAAA